MDRFNSPDEIDVKPGEESVSTRFPKRECLPKALLRRHLQEALLLGSKLLGRCEKFGTSIRRGIR